MVLRVWCRSRACALSGSTPCVRAPGGLGRRRAEGAAVSTATPRGTMRSGEVWPVAAGMWDRMLAFLGFEEDVDEEEAEAVVASGRAASGLGAYADRTVMGMAHGESAPAVG